jgi:hypothetical protein
MIPAREWGTGAIMGQRCYCGFIVETLAVYLENDAYLCASVVEYWRYHEAPVAVPAELSHPGGLPAPVVQRPVGAWP